jgi:hypothetical protein
MDEDLEKHAIEAIPVVNSLSFHAADEKNKSGYHVNLRCSGASSYGGCGVKQGGLTHRFCLSIYTLTTTGTKQPWLLREN